MGDNNALATHSNKLFIGNLPPITDGELRAAFAPFGEVLDIHIGKKDGKDIFAFIQLDSHASAAKAKQELSKTLVMGKNVKIKWAAPQATVWVGDLEAFVTNDMLKEAFAQFGEVENAIVVSDPIMRRSKGYGFVTFTNKIISKKVITICAQNMFLIGPSWRPVRVVQAQFDDQEEGFEKNNTNQFVHTNARFAEPGSAEFQFALKWRNLTNTQQSEAEQMKEKHANEAKKMSEQQEEAKRAAWLEEQKQIKQQQLRQREMEALQIALQGVGNHFGIVGTRQNLPPVGGLFGNMSYQDAGQRPMGLFDTQNGRGSGHNLGPMHNAPPHNMAPGQNASFNQGPSQGYGRGRPFPPPPPPAPSFHPPAPVHSYPPHNPAAAAAAAAAAAHVGYARGAGVPYPPPPPPVPVRPAARNAFGAPPVQGSAGGPIRQPFQHQGMMGRGFRPSPYTR